MNQDNGEQRLSKWIEQLHDKLADHEVAPPEGLWADIEAAVAQQQAKPQKSHFVVLRRWAATAAVAALTIGGGYLLWEAPVSSQQEEAVAQAAQEAQATQENPPESSPTEPQSAVLLRRRSPRLTTQRDRPPMQEKLAMATKTAIDSEETAKTETTTAEVIDDAKQQTVENVSAAMTADQAVVSELNRQIANMTPADEKSGRTMSLGLYAMNGFSNQTSSNGVLMADALVMQYNKVYENSYASAARISEPVYLTGYEERENHHRPVAFGLTLSYPLQERLSLTTGIVYTKLTSDFTQVMRKQQIQREQTLHYVGVPVGLDYRLWAAKGFRAYLSAGATVYWNVATSVVTEGVSQEMEKDRVQLSLNGSLGLQYDIIPEIGLYAEPGVSFYPDNKSHIRNFFKDKPTNLSLQVGLRVNLQR